MSVTSIVYGAFYGCSGLTSITIPESVKRIGGYAFSDCSSLTSITISEGVTSIGDYAFSGCSGLQEMYCYAEQVPATGNNPFYGISLNEATLYVPANAIEDYKSAILWSDFGTILPITSDTPVAVQNVEASGVKSLHDAYSLDGRRLTAPKRGLNILRMSNGSTKKVVVK